MIVAIKIRTLFRLGWINVLRVLVYRISLKLRLNPAQRIIEAVPLPPFYFPPGDGVATDREAVRSWQGSINIFGHHPVDVFAEPPDWHTDIISGRKSGHQLSDWWKIPDFDPVGSDIKLVWELSRMDWVLAFAQHASLGDKNALCRLNTWLSDWCEANPPYKGPNWKCGQEASIRVMHLAISALVLGQVKAPAAGLVALIQVHLKRIAPTMSYAIAQNNNHGTSEAAALWIGGTWLQALGIGGAADAWARMGRQRLEERVAHLVSPDGSFSQYSVNYHRMVLDTLSIVEVWRRYLGLPSFSAAWGARARAAVEWLHGMVDIRTGDVPNLGANDGARLIPLTDTNYRDYRPSVQLAMALFGNRLAYSGAGAWHNPLRWLGVDVPTANADPAGSRLADDGGFAVLRLGEAMALLRYPRFHFRPGQADALHLDFWVNGLNILRDAGSFSYNADVEVMNYFSGVAGHNTFQFDNREQMPRLGRFLFGDWLSTDWIKPLDVTDSMVQFGAGYRDASGAWAKRVLTLSSGELAVEDLVGGKFKNATLRWRLAPGHWVLNEDGDGAIQVMDLNRSIKLRVWVEGTIARSGLVEGWESRYYQQRTVLPVLEVEVGGPSKIITEVCWEK